jgi:23S rRNA-/tRNA-specific pseudouridylate synthase
MCTQLTQNGRILVFGKSAIIRSGTTTANIVWGTYRNGHPVVNARIESLNKIWMPLNYTIMSIMVDSFLERDVEFKFKSPTDVAVIYKEDHFLVVTEPAGIQVKKTHARQPCFERLHELLAA